MEERWREPAALAEQYAGMLYRLAYARTGSRADAEDVMQEVFVRLLRARPEFRDEEHAKAWLLRVTEEPNTADYRDLEISVVDKHNEVLSNTE